MSNWYFLQFQKASECDIPLGRTIDRGFLRRASFLSHRVSPTGGTAMSLVKGFEPFVKLRWHRPAALIYLLSAAFTLLLCISPAFAAGKPNTLVIFGDDVGQTDISAYSMGLMGFHTPNIDRVAKEGMLFTDYYAENSC